MYTIATCYLNMESSILPVTNKGMTKDFSKFGQYDLDMNFTENYSKVLYKCTIVHRKIT